MKNSGRHNENKQALIPAAPTKTPHRIPKTLKPLELKIAGYFPGYLSTHRNAGKILLGGGGGLNIICPNETCWSQMHKMILS